MTRLTGTIAVFLVSILAGLLIAWLIITRRSPEHPTASASPATGPRAATVFTPTAWEFLPLVSKQASQSATATPMGTATPTETPLPTSTIVPSPSATATASASPTASPTPTATSVSGTPVRRVNAYPFSGDVSLTGSAIFWFGNVTSSENYADVRVGYNDQMLSIHVAVFDRLLWYDQTPALADLTNWDAVTLFLDRDRNSGQTPGPNAYQWIAQLKSGSAAPGWQAVYQGDGSSWIVASLPFTTTRLWRGNALNDAIEDRGWAVTFEIPFDSLGMTGPPAEGTVWGLGVALHDRDNSVGPPLPDQTWPEAMYPDQPGTWGQMGFGLPGYSTPSVPPGGTVTVRQGLNGASVPDAAVGGHTNCGEGMDFWTGWGNANYAGLEDFNVQNQFDVADFPCFSKYYVTFPLDSLPSGKTILTATLTLHQFGGSNPSLAQASFIQVLTVADNWDEATLTWNNAPLAVENTAGTRVAPLPGFPGWPGVPSQWDLSRAVAEAYAAGTPLRLAIYSSDAAYHSGKYFSTSDTGDWNATARPTLTVIWGTP